MQDISYHVDKHSQSPHFTAALTVPLLQIFVGDKRLSIFFYIKRFFLPLFSDERFHLHSYSSYVLNGGVVDSTSYLALSRVDALTRSLEVTANNLANSNTDGFKSSRVLFSDYLSKQRNAHGLGSEKTLDYNQDKATYRETSQGTLRQTGNPLDIGINGEGFFNIRTKDGVKLTRNGQFSRTSDGTIVDLSGNALLDDQNRPITLDPNDDVYPLSIASDGTISTQRQQAIAKIGISTVDDLNTLHAEGNHLFRPTTRLHQVDNTEMRQGMLESSNVNAIQETTDLMRTQREYDLNFQLIQTESTRLQNAIDKITTEPSS